MLVKWGGGVGFEQKREGRFADLLQHGAPKECGAQEIEQHHHAKRKYETRAGQLDETQVHAAKRAKLTQWGRCDVDFTIVKCVVLLCSLAKVVCGHKNLYYHRFNRKK